MILGADHLAVSCRDIKAASQQLDAAGYRVRFLQEAVPNRGAKRRFLAAYEPSHAIAYCQAAEGLALELTQHTSPLCDAPSPYQVLLGAPLPGSLPFSEVEPAWAAAWRDTLGCREPVAAMWPPLHAQYWYDAADQPATARARAALLPVVDVERAQDFWSAALGLRRVADGTVEAGRRWTRLAIHAPVPNWSLTLILVEGAQRVAAPLLDAPGFPCLALLSNALDRDGERLQQAGAAESTGEFQVEVNGKPLRVAVYRAPGGALIELIELHRGR